jgi:hypothetical protein
VVQGLFDVGEAGVIAGAQVEGERVGHDAATTDVDVAMIVHLSKETAAQLDWTDAAAVGTRKHDLDHIL